MVLADGVMAAQKFLVLLVEVRVLVGQQKNVKILPLKEVGFFCFTAPSLPDWRANRQPIW